VHLIYLVGTELRVVRFFNSPVICKWCDLLSSFYVMVLFNFA
jgi:hypothetical protein